MQKGCALLIVLYAFISWIENVIFSIFLTGKYYVCLSLHDLIKCNDDIQQWYAAIIWQSSFIQQQEFSNSAQTFLQ